MQRVSRNVWFDCELEPYCICCEFAGDAVVQITGNLYWHEQTGKHISFAIEKVCCDCCHSQCFGPRCRNVIEARRLWAREANVRYAHATAEIFSL